MKLTDEERTFVTFESSIEDEGEFDEEGTLVVPGGRTIISELVSALRKNGADVSDVGQHSWFGWRFEVERTEETFELILQYPGPWLLFFTRKNSFIEKFSRSAQARGVPDMREQLQRALSQDRRFMKIAWFSPSEYQGFSGKQEV